MLLRRGDVYKRQHKYFVTYQLPVIFVGSHHIGSDTLATGFGSECTYHIIGFVACHFPVSYTHLVGREEEAAFIGDESLADFFSVLVADRDIL